MSCFLPRWAVAVYFSFEPSTEHRENNLNAVFVVATTNWPYYSIRNAVPDEPDSNLIRWDFLILWSWDLICLIPISSCYEHSFPTTRLLTTLRVDGEVRTVLRGPEVSGYCYSRSRGHFYLFFSCRDPPFWSLRAFNFLLLKFARIQAWEPKPHTQITPIISNQKPTPSGSFWVPTLATSPNSSDYDNHTRVHFSISDLTWSPSSRQSNWNRKRRLETTKIIANPCSVRKKDKQIDDKTR